MVETGRPQAGLLHGRVISSNRIQCHIMKMTIRGSRQRDETCSDTHGDAGPDRETHHAVDLFSDRTSYWDGEEMGTVVPSTFLFISAFTATFEEAAVRAAACSTCLATEFEQEAPPAVTVLRSAV